MGKEFSIKMEVVDALTGTVRKAYKGYGRPDNTVEVDGIVDPVTGEAVEYFWGGLVEDGKTDVESSLIKGERRTKGAHEKLVFREFNVNKDAFPFEYNLTSKNGAKFSGERKAIQYSPQGIPDVFGDRAVVSADLGELPDKRRLSTFLFCISKAQPKAMMNRDMRMAIDGQKNDRAALLNSLVLHKQKPKGDDDDMGFLLPL